MKYLICWGLLLFLLTNCGIHLPQTELSYKGKRHPCHVAILPFTNETKQVRLGRLVYRIFLSQLSMSKDFQVIEEGRVRNLLRLERCLVGHEPPPRVLRVLGQRLKVEAIITGTVLEAEEDPEHVSLAFIIWVRDSKTGDLLWSTYHARRGEEYQKVLHFGKVFTLTSLTERMVQEILNDWEKKGLGGCLSK